MALKLVLSIDYLLILGPKDIFPHIWVNHLEGPFIGVICYNANAGE